MAPNLALSQREQIRDMIISTTQFLTEFDMGATWDSLREVMEDFNDNEERMYVMFNKETAKMSHLTTSNELDVLNKSLAQKKQELEQADKKKTEESWKFSLEHPD